MLMQNFGRQTKGIMVFFKMAESIAAWFSWQDNRGTIILVEVLN